MTDTGSDKEKALAQFAAWEAKAESFKRDNPGVSYTKVLMEKTVGRLRQGLLHPTLGHNIHNGQEDWWKAGASTFNHYSKRFQIDSGSKLVDYGCGSLRVGAHFIRYLDPGHYFGLEIARGLYDMGLEVLGPELLAEKQPHLGITDSPALEDAVAFGADFVISNAVAFHVHPEEMGLYLGNLLRLTHKAGAMLIFDTKIADEPLRYRDRAWAWPLQTYIDALAPLQLVDQSKAATRVELGVEFENRVLAFRRD